MRVHKFALSAIALFALSAFSSREAGCVLAEEEVVAAEAETVDAFATPENAENFQFEAEVSRMMDIVINSLYTNKDVFLRELISNASDALDKIRFLSITDAKLLEDKAEMEVRVEYDKEAKTLTIRDSGIGMTKEDLVKNLGTVARSGTTKFLDAMGEGTADMSMIGQFGVGFYSAFLVADKVRVASKNTNDPVQHVWESKNGETGFIVAEDPRGNTLGRGTEITLHLKEDAMDYAEASKLQELIEHYSEFIMHPIYLRTTEIKEVPKEKETSDEDAEEKDDLDEEKEESEEGEEKEEKEGDDEDDDDDDEEEEPEMEEVTTYTWDKINTNQAIWTRSKEDITDDEYQSFWKTVTEESWTNATAWTHFNAEGNINFKSILYLPSSVPMYMKHGQFDQAEEGLRLYVKRVLISDTFDLMPKYLSYIRGVVDSEDLPLNVNRETLQESKIIKVIQKKLVRKVLEMLKKLSEEETPTKDDFDDEDDEEDEEEEKDLEHPYLKWYKEFGPSIKMGIIDDDSNRNKLAKLVRYKTSKASGEDDWVGLDEYVGRMKEWQTDIFYFPGEKVADLEHSQFMDRFKAKDVEVIYMIDPVDEYMLNSLRTYDGKKFQAITKEGVKFGDEDEDLVTRREKAYKEKFKPLTTWLNKLYGKAVSRVIVSKKLEGAPAIISSADYAHTANMERILKAQAFQHGRPEHEIMATKVFEINPRHPFVTKLLEQLPPEKEEGDDSEEEEVPESAVDAAWMLHDMALLNSGFPIHDVKAYSGRMVRVIQTALDVDSVALEDEIDPPVEEDEPPEVDEDAEGINMDDFDYDADMGEEL